MGVQPVREAAGSAAAVGRKHVVCPFLGQVVHRIGIAAIDDVGFLDEVALALEQPVVNA